MSSIKIGNTYFSKEALSQMSPSEFEHHYRTYLGMPIKKALEIAKPYLKKKVRKKRSAE